MGSIPTAKAVGYFHSSASPTLAATQSESTEFTEEITSLFEFITAIAETVAVCIMPIRIAPLPDNLRLGG